MTNDQRTDRAFEAPRTGAVPIWACTVSAPVVPGAQGLPAIHLFGAGVDAVLQVITIGLQEAVLGVFSGEDGEPLDVFRMQDPDPLRNMAYLLAKALAGFTEPAMCLPTARIAARYPEAAWTSAAHGALYGTEAELHGCDAPQGVPGLLDADTGLPREGCVGVIKLDAIIRFVPATPAEGA